jgi:hypothetical protein
MKLYREMNAEERSEADLRMALRFRYTKEIAEQDMEWFDQQTPEVRARLRKEDFPA